MSKDSTLSSRDVYMLMAMLWVLCSVMQIYSMFHVEPIQRRTLELVSQRASDIRSEDIDRALEAITRFRLVYCCLYPVVILIKAGIIATLFKVFSILIDCEFGFKNLFFISIFALWASGSGGLISLLALNKFYNMSDINETLRLIHPLSIGALIPVDNPLVKHIIYGCDLSELLWWLGAIVAFKQCYPQAESKKFYFVLIPGGIAVFGFSICMGMLQSHTG